MSSSSSDSVARGGTRKEDAKKPSNEIVNYYEKMGSTVKSRYYNPNKLAPQHPFRAVITGKSGAGKSNLILNIISKCSCFNQIYLVAMNNEEKLYQYLEKKLGDDLTVITDINELPGLKATVKTKIKKKGSKEEVSSDEEEDETDDSDQKLIIFDDLLAESPAVLKKITSYFIRGRNNGYSVIMTSQSWYSIPRTIRLNTSDAFFMSMGSQKDCRQIVKDLVQGITPDQILDCFKLIKKKYGNFIWVDSRSTTGHQLRLNFDEFVEINE